MDCQRVTIKNSTPFSTLRLKIEASINPGIFESCGKVSFRRCSTYASACAGLASPHHWREIMGFDVPLYGDRMPVTPDGRFIDGSIWLEKSPFRPPLYSTALCASASRDPVSHKDRQPRIAPQHQVSSPEKAKRRHPLDRPMRPRELARRGWKPSTRRPDVQPGTDLDVLDSQGQRRKTVS